MTKQEAIKMICETFAEITDKNFPCICGENPLADKLNSEDIKILNNAMSILKIYKYDILMGQI